MQGCRSLNEIVLMNYKLEPLHLRAESVLVDLKCLILLEILFATLLI